MGQKAIYGQTQVKEKVMPKMKLLILSSDADDYLKIINNARLPGLSVEVSRYFDPGDKNLHDCDIIFGSPDLLEQALNHAGSLKWVQSMWAGVSPLLVSEMRRDYTLTGVKGIFGTVMGEYVICHILMHERKCIERYKNQMEKKWDMTLPGTLQGKCVGIMGLGSIGRAVAAMVKSFGVETRGFSRSRTSCENIDQCFLSQDLLEFVKDLDYLVCLLPDTPDSRGLIEKKVLEAMKDTVVIINAGRGTLIDEVSLIQALENHTIGGAVLDVFIDEPLPEAHPLWKTPNTLITSHTAALTFPDAITPIFIDNYHRFISGQPMKYVIDFERGY